MTFESLNLIPVIPEIFVLCMACLVLIVDLFIGQRTRVVTYVLTQLTLLGAIILTCNLYVYPETVIFNGGFIHDQIASLLKIVIYVLSFFVFLYSREYIEDRKMPFGEYYVLSLLSVLGMMILVSSYSFLVLFLALELVTLPQYALVASRRESGECSEAAMKYFVLGSVASGMLLYGLSMIYGATKQLGIADVAMAIHQLPLGENLILVFGLVFLVVGIAFKLGAVPFHMWVPDVYQGAPSSVTLFIASASKIAAFGMAIRLLVDAMPELHSQWQNLLIAIAILSMAVGNFVAIVQTNLKRMLAYSSIAHIGYMLLGLAAGTSAGYAAAMFYMITYSVMSLGAFGLIVLLSHAGFEAENIEDFKGLNTRSPWTAFLMLLVMFSLAGIPPIIGFFAKVAVFEALVSANLVWLAVVALVFAIIGVYYYLRVVKTMYFDKPTNESPVIIQSIDMRAAISLNCLMILAMGIVPSGLFTLCRNAFMG
jgi:NADH-quinone oxidoreductase subunit N